MFDPNLCIGGAALDFTGDFLVDFGVGCDDENFFEAFGEVLLEVGTPIGFAGFDFDGDAAVGFMSDDVGEAVDRFLECDGPAFAGKFLGNSVFPVFVFEASPAGVVWGWNTEGAEGVSAFVCEFCENQLAAVCFDVNQGEQAFLDAGFPDGVAFSPAQLEVSVALDCA
ncbi:hypothetical protein FJY63_13870, partial [Candidatus Sumerlaeota bacterium]|nr:hypothetical protein [Candidatus Sumerlaeota bacterium]